MSQLSSSKRPPIAVVGVSALFPGSTDSTGFWNDILAGTDRMTDVPPSHWLIDDHFDADPSVPDRTYGRRGGFLDPIDFDAMSFGVPPSVVPSTDTAQLLALIVAQRVLDDAMRGQFTELDRTRASVILGVTSGQELFGAMASRMNRPMWLQGMRRAGIPEDVALEACDRILALHPEWTESTFPGLLGNVVAGRIANRLDLGGTNCVTDAACASSFSALSMGVNELYLGDSDLVIAGGVDTMNDIFMYMCFSKTPALSKSEDIRPFSDQADGTMLGEGIGMVALKRLEDAESDGNDIYCIVNGVGSSSDGRSKSVYAPVSSGQARALGNAYDKAGYGPDTVELIEAHGTGTVAGDAAEFGGLELAFDASQRTDRQWCALGSVKSQIGHTKAAAGAAGLFKVVMALHHKVLPQTAKIDQPNPNLDLENSPFHLNTTTRPWVRGSQHERRGSVSSFGFGGSNFHVALSEYTGTGARAPRLRSSDVEMVVLCGTDADDVAAQAAGISDELVDGQLPFLAQSSQRAYDASKHARLAIIATDEDDLRGKLDQAVDALAKRRDDAFSIPSGVHFGLGSHSGDVAFLFPGQGSQYVGMGADLAMNFAEAMTAWDLAADQEWDEATLHDVVFPITSFEEGAASANQALLTATHWAQPAIGTMSLSMLAILRAIGLEARHVGGHSFGEITALHAGGVLTDTDMLRVAQRRGHLMAEAAQTPGSMTAVTGSIESVRSILEGSDADVVIANHNSHRQVVLSGPTEAIERVEAELTAQGVVAKRLPVATAFHSSVVSGASSAFGEFLADVAFSAPIIPVHANETAEPYDGDDEPAMRAQLARQLSNSVRFVEMVEAMHDAGARTFVEVGPSSVLTGLVGNILDGRDHRVIPLDKKNKGGLSAFHNGLGQLVAAGVDMNLEALWQGYGDMANPADAPTPKLAIPINGANYDSPYPPHDLNELTEANPVTTSVPTAPSPAVATPPPATPPPTTPPPTTPPPATPPPATRQPAAAPEPAPAPVTTFPPIAPPVARVAPIDAPDSAVLAAYQSAQQHTAAAHTAYLNSMAQAHSAFLDAARHGIAVLGQLAGAPVPAIASATLPPVAAATPAPIPEPIPVPIAAAPPPIAAAPVVSEPVAAAPPAPAPAPAPTPVVAPAVHAAPAPTPTPSAAPPAPVAAMTVEAMTPKLLSVVSDRTGYPSEMLTMEMELESDLGIDSIKRVEILSAMQDLVPELPEVDLGVMASLSTLGEIVDYLTAQAAGNTTPAPAVHAAPAPTPTPTPSAAPPAPVAAMTVEAMTPKLLSVVSDRTGYPSEMLTMEMELESDLGIDSIKRVEILSAMQDLVPELPEVDLGVMASLSTLGEIVDYLTAQAAGNTTPAPAVHAAPAPTPTPSAAPPAPVAAMTVEAMTPKLLSVVSDRTGYPSEMLTMEMELESDLGIDSIKRVEILSAMQDLVPELPEVDLGVMASLSTLGEIVDYLTAQAAGNTTPAPAVHAVAPSAQAETPGAFGRFVVKEHPLPLPGSPLPGLSGAPVGVVGDPDGIGSALVAALVAAGTEARLVDMVGDDGLDCVIYLGNLRRVTSSGQAAALNREAFDAAKSFAARAASGGIFVAVDDQGGTFATSGGDADRVWAAGLAALLRTAAIEWPSVLTKMIDVEGAGRTAARVAADIAGELLNGGADREVGLRADGTRIGLRAESIEVAGGVSPIGTDDVVVVSGGGRGVTAATIVELARSSHAAFVLLGRSPLADEPAHYRAAGDDAALKKLLLAEYRATDQQPTPAQLNQRVGAVLANREIRATLASIETAGGRGSYIAVDITDAAAVATALGTVRSDIGPITGLIHGAGVLADKLIADKSGEQFAAVFDTKVQGLQNLLDATAADELRVLCLFSSVAARTGNLGQADYAMANDVLNKVATHERVRRGGTCVVKSLGWGPWAGGMVTPALEAHFASMGVELIELGVGARMLVDELSSPQTDQVEVVLGGGVLAPNIAATQRVDA